MEPMPVLCGAESESDSHDGPAEPKGPRLALCDGEELVLVHDFAPQDAVHVNAGHFDLAIVGELVRVRAWQVGQGPGSAGAGDTAAVAAAA